MNNQILDILICEILFYLDSKQDFENVLICCKYIWNRKDIVKKKCFSKFRELSIIDNILSKTKYVNTLQDWELFIPYPYEEDITKDIIEEDYYKYLVKIMCQSKSLYWFGSFMESHNVKLQINIPKNCELIKYIKLSESNDNFKISFYNYSIDVNFLIDEIIFDKYFPHFISFSNFQITNFKDIPMNIQIKKIIMDQERRYKIINNFHNNCIMILKLNNVNVESYKLSISNGTVFDIEKL